MMSAWELVCDTPRLWGMIAVYVIVLALIVAMTLDNKHKP